jgi:Flp pilus assembly protein TadD
MLKDFNRYRDILICLALALSTVAVYYQVYSYDFNNYDDPQYVYENPHIQKGFTLESVKWGFTAGHVAYWHPLTWFSHMLDWQLFGRDAGGHHVVNLIFHVANVLILFAALKRMTNAVWPSAFVAALFALHPLHVESVAWVAERKDVLSAFFLFLTIWAYAHFVEKSRVRNYLLVVLFYTFALMSKPVVVTLPFVLLLLDYWPLERFSLGRTKAGGKSSLHSLLIEKIPLFAMALVSCVITFLHQKKIGAMNVGQEWGFFVRITNVPISYLQYIIKMIWPSRLAFFYPHPGFSISVPYAAMSAVLLVVATILVFQFASKHRYLLTGWLWFLGTLVPVIGIIQVGDQAFADRYSYITLTGLFIIATWGVPELLGKWQYGKTFLWVSSLVVLSVLAVCAYIQQRYWKDGLTLCRRAIEVTEDNFKAHFFMARMLFLQDDNEQVIEHCRETVRVKPNFVDAHNLLGTALSKTGKVDEAIECYEDALEISPDFGPAHANLGLALAMKGEYDEAVEHYRMALETIDEPPIRSDLGDLLLHIKRYEEAATEYREVLSAEPDNADVHNKLGFALAHTGRYDEAVEHFNQAIQIDPNHTDAKNNLKLVSAEQEKRQNKGTEGIKE